MQSKLPVLFITHGSPMLAVEPGKTGPLLTQLGQQLDKLDIKAILVISAHWITRDMPMLTSGEQLETIHDFGGFPRELYQIEYPAKGSPEVAQLIKKELEHDGIKVGLDDHRGLDHGAWIPLEYLFPKVNVPVIQLSIAWPMDAKQAIEFGQHLKTLRNQGILIIASGSMTHNLYDVGYNDEQEASYIKPFVRWVESVVKAHDLNAMQHYRKLAPYAKQAHPTDDHFLPLIIALAASDKDEKVTELEGGITYQALAMNNYVFGQY
ncbi:class III extradiol ring-cleavage dioxygenase [Orbus sasakiae]|uniref:Class III extradiol ring-cleavage dioxygenase n=1 Tax=Orbus sasakiae TaxID=1078475 RepID=A0ABP9N1G9_9GAMM